MLKKTKILIGALSTIGLLGVTTAATVTPVLLYHNNLSNTNKLHNNIHNEWNKRPANTRVFNFDVKNVKFKTDNTFAVEKKNLLIQQFNLYIKTKMN